MLRVWGSSAVLAVLLAFQPILVSAQDTVSDDAARNNNGIAQAEAISRLIEVWGFVKYHHSDARAGNLGMDREFFDLYEKIASGQPWESVLGSWLVGMGPGDPCDPCARDEVSEAGRIAIASDTPAWIASLPTQLAEPLQAIYANRTAATSNFQVEAARGVGNTLFRNERDYSSTEREDRAIRMLAIARAWNTLRYWFPYRDVMDEPVETILVPAVKETLTAKTPQEYHKALLRMAAKSDDGHVGVSAMRSSVSPPGDCVIPFSWRIVEGQLVIDGATLHQSGLLKRGDVVTGIAGLTIEDLEAKYGPFIAASNASYHKSILAKRLASGECGDHIVSIERQGKTLEVAVPWISPDDAKVDLYSGHTRPGPTIQQGDDGFTYVRFTELKNEELGQMLEAANAGKGLILDMRGYVADFHVFTFGALLISETTEFAKFTNASLATPGQFTWTEPISIRPSADGSRITVPVVALLNEQTISSPEYHAMAWRAAGVTIIGSTTAGA